MEKERGEIVEAEIKDFVNEIIQEMIATTGKLIAVRDEEYLDTEYTESYRLSGVTSILRDLAERIGERYTYGNSDGWVRDIGDLWDRLPADH